MKKLGLDDADNPHRAIPFANMWSGLNNQLMFIFILPTWNMDFPALKTHAANIR